MTARTSWTDTAPHGHGLRFTPLGTVLVCLLMVLLFVGAIHLGQRGMCAWHDNHIRYCPHYVQEPVR
jgi:hypothetical protein